MRIGPCLILIFLLAGCGFHLRGSQGVDVALERIHVSAANVYGAFVQELERTLQQSGIEVVDSSAAAPWSLRVLGERTSRRAIATTSRVQVSEYELRMEVRFELLDTNGDTVIEPVSLIAERIYSFDSSSLVGSSEEEELLKEEMRRDLIGQMIRRVDASVRSPAGEQEPARG